MTETSGFVEFKDTKVWFERIGSGPNAVLLIPGPIGTCRTDYEELINSEDELDFDKFTAIAVDPPGLGKSRPPQRKYGKDYYNIDCEAYHAVIQHLGISKFSIIGWSEGAKVALLMATRYPSEVEALVLIGITSFASNKNIIGLKNMTLVKSWPKNRVDNYLRGYESIDEIQKQWNRYLQFAEFYNQYFPEDIFKDKYKLVKCATLIFHGDKDPIVELAQIQDISNKLPFAKVHRFPNGEHHCHQKFAIKFTKYVQDHIINRDQFVKMIQDEISEANNEIGFKEFSSHMHV